MSESEPISEELMPVVRFRYPFPVFAHISLLLPYYLTGVLSRDRANV